MRGALWVTAVGLVPHTAALLLRYVRVGHGPYMLKYEVLSSNTWIAVAMLILFVWRRPNWAPLALIVLPASILMMGLGLFTNPEARSLPPTLRSLWLVFHVVFNKLAVGAFLLSLASAIVLLRKLGGASGQWLDRLPGPEVIEAYTVRFVGFGFVFWTTTIGAGAIWANAILLHARIFFRIKARAAAWGTIACFVLSVLTVLIFPFIFPSLHSAYFQS